jgi:hypothetical protein
VVTCLVHVAWGDVSATPEPPDAPLSLEVAVVEMHRGRVGVLRVHDGAQAAREKGDALPRGVPLPPVLAAELAPVVGGGEGLLRHSAVDDREVAAGLLPYLATSENARDSATTVLPHPSILAGNSQGIACEMEYRMTCLRHLQQLLLLMMRMVCVQSDRKQHMVTHAVSLSVIIMAASESFHSLGARKVCLLRDKMGWVETWRYSLELALAVDLLHGLADSILCLAAHLLKLGTHRSVGSAGLAEAVGRGIDGLR